MGGACRNSCDTEAVRPIELFQIGEPAGPRREAYSPIRTPATIGKSALREALSPPDAKK